MGGKTQGRFGKNTNKSLRYCKHCLNPKSRSYGYICPSSNNKIQLSLNKNKRWELLSVLTENESFTTSKRHYRNDHRYFLTHLPWGRNTQTKWPGSPTDYLTRPVQFKIPMEQLEEKGILKHWQTDQGNNPYTDQWGQVHVPDPEKPHPADAKVVNMYIMENPHLMWEESRLLDVAMGKEDFIYWICRGSGDAEPFRLWNSNPGVIKYDPDSTHIRVYQSPASKIGRWCCCKDGHTGQTMGRRDLSNYIYRQEDILKPKKNKSRRNLMVEDFSLPQKKRKGRSNNTSTIKKKKVSY